MEGKDITQIVNTPNFPKTTSSLKVFDDIYQELHQIASNYRRRWHGNHTLNTTALVHEAYEKLKPLGGAYKNRKHYFATAAKIMRQVLINYAERSLAEKRNPHLVDITVSNFSDANGVFVEELLTIEKLLTLLESHNERQSRIVECRIFGGMSIEETANALAVSPSTVKREWALLSAWLYREIKTLDSTCEFDAVSVQKTSSYQAAF